MKHKILPFLTIALMSLVFKGLAQEIPFREANWISPVVERYAVHRPCPVFLKSFSVKKDIKKAVLFITALGLYEAELNGSRVGDAYFTPGWTDYNKRLQYQTYDVTKLLRNDNNLKVTVGEGWYRGYFRGEKPRNIYGGEAGLLAELHIEYKDGRSEEVKTDTTWKSTTGPIRYSELYDGELFDARVELHNWKPVKVLQYSKAILVANEAEPVRKHETFPPLKIFTAPNGDQIVDFGQNMAGWVKIRVTGKKGDTIKIAHAEVLDPAGNFYVGNLRTAKATDQYILKGEREEVFEPHFTYHGFRYAKVSGFTPTKENCMAVALYSDMKKTGTFECSDPMINRLAKNIEWSLNSNFFDIPTDCPQRSERMGWTGDAQVFAPTASFLRDTRNFYKKWLKDLSSGQAVNGALPNTIPSLEANDDNRGGTTGWSDAATIVPWSVYEFTGEPEILRTQYQSMKAWVDYMKNSSKDWLYGGGGYGDWYAPGFPTDMAFLSQCYWAHSAEIMSNTAAVLGKKEDAEMYKDQLSKIKGAFLKKFVSSNGLLTANTQTAYVLALEFGMLPKDLKQIAANRLVELIKEEGNHLSTGFLGTPYLLKVLSDNGHPEMAYTLLNQKTSPSWLYPITKGATTMWEKWDAIRPDGSVQAFSLNHYSYGAVGRWLYESVAGICPLKPGYSKILIKPIIGGGLTWAKGSYLSGFGKIASEWKVEGNNVTMKVEIPKGTTAKVYIPGKGPIQVKSGNHIFAGKIN